MKSFFLIGILFVFSPILFAQENSANYTITLGVNTIDNNTLANSIPLINGNLSFKTPFFVTAERRFHSDFSTSLSLSTNQLEINSVNKLYVAVDASGQFYFDDYLFRSENIETYAGLGIGHYFFENKGYNTANFLGGIRYWFSEHYGVSTQGMGKVGLPPVNENIRNIYQWNMGLVWRN